MKLFSSALHFITYLLTFCFCRIFIKISLRILDQQGLNIYFTDDMLYKQ